jgi:acyl-CoA dehydrogenase
VGEFEVKDQPVSESDLIAQGRDAWDAVFGTITLGKFFLGFGSIGICEHALEEAVTHLGQRILYHAPAIEMPHIRFAMEQAWIRLTAMKLYAFRALDYVQASSDSDRRYLLYCAVQKARVSTEGVKVMSQLLECIGAKGFESDTYFEMALRDAQLIPSLEGSTHVNLRLTSQFIPQYLGGVDLEIVNPTSLSAIHQTSPENPFLMRARNSALNTIEFPHFLNPYRPLISIPNVRLFAKQGKAFQSFMRKAVQKDRDPNSQTDLILGQCLATIAYGQMIAENAVCFAVSAQIVSAIFHLLVIDLGAIAMTLASSGLFSPPLAEKLVRRTVIVPQTARSDWDFVAGRVVTR